MANLKITLSKSLIGSKPLQRKNAEALGLRKTGQTVEQPDNPQIRGAITKISHLVTVEEV